MMRAVVVYESMFGNTRQIAEAIADSMSQLTPVDVMNVNWDGVSAIGDADLLVIGAPTHAHSLSTPASRQEAVEWANDPHRELNLDPDAMGIGVREWLDLHPTTPESYAAFDTRADMIRLFTGAASTAIDRILRRRGLNEVVSPESFTVSMHNELKDGELDRARAWGRKIAEAALARHGASQV